MWRQTCTASYVHWFWTCTEVDHKCCMPYHALNMNICMHRHVTCTCSMETRNYILWIESFLIHNVYVHHVWALFAPKDMIFFIANLCANQQQVHLRGHPFPTSEHARDQLAEWVCVSHGYCPNLVLLIAGLTRKGKRVNSKQHLCNQTVVFFSHSQAIH